ncbi:MAG TPA: methyltransferase domain-containing protein [Solirubrobacteraceae bacterium]|nr:methyltransferase domain-containing protein [Solirubrobacteraceae bacterium]
MADSRSEAYAAIDGVHGRPLLWCDTPAWESEPRVACSLILSGWALADPGPATVTVQRSDGLGWTAVQSGARLDLASVYGERYGEDEATSGGWCIGLDVGGWEEGLHELTITARDAQGRVTSVARTIVVDPIGLHADWLAARRPCQPRRWPHRAGHRARLAVWLDEAGTTEQTRASVTSQTLEDWQSLVGENLPGALAAFCASDAQLLAVIGGGCVLEPHALQAFAETEAAVGPCDLIYADDDELAADGRRSRPRLKPQWSPELLLATDYIGPFVALGRRAAERLLDEPREPPQNIYELMVALVGDDPRVERVPDILASWVGGPPLVGGDAAGRPIRALAQRNDTEVDVRPVAQGIRDVRFAPRGEPPVSVIIPTAAMGGHLNRCLEAIAGRSTYRGLEVVIANTSGGELGSTANALRHLRHQIVDVPGPFNYSRANNAAAAAAEGEYLIFLNDDCEVVTPDWVQLLLGAVQQPGVGLAGADLRFPGGLMQCAGVRVTLEHATQIYQGFPPPSDGGPSCLLAARNCSAVGTACAAMSAALFDSIDGFDELLAVELGDVDLGLRVLSSGQRVVWTPNVRAIHHERGSRGRDEQHPADHVRFRQRWATLRAAGDPFYNPGLNAEVDFEPRAQPPVLPELAGLLARSHDEGPPTRPVPEAILGTDGRDWAERFSPWEHAGALIDAEHTARYRWLAPAANGRDVLDAACGMAYGTSVLRRAGARRAVGVDISAKTIAEASLLLDEEQIELLQGDVQHLPFADASFDLVACFETIEHVDDPGHTLDELRRVLRPDGLLAVSSPNRGVYNPGNPFHVAELTPPELREALGQRFGNVAMFAQQAWLASALLRSEELRESSAEQLGAQFGSVARLASEREYYTVGLASDAPLPELAGVTLLADPGGPYALGEQLLSTQEALARAKQERGALRVKLATTSRELEAAHGALAASEEQRRTAEHWLQAIQRSLSWQLTSPLRAANRMARGRRRSPPGR